MANAVGREVRTSSGARKRERLADMALSATQHISTDLGSDIGSRQWWAGLAVLLGASGAAIAMTPDFRPIPVAPSVTLSDAELDEARAQMIMPLALGGDTGRRMAATEAVVPLKASPERPRIELTATLGRGDGFGRLLQRAGVSRKEADQVTAMVSGVTSLSDIEPGTRVDVVLGRRSDKRSSRPLESVDFRARLDLALSVGRDGDRLFMKQEKIAVDDTPLRIRGTVGSSLYRSARAAGAPADAVRDYLRVIRENMPISSIRASDEFDIVVGYRRAETGEVEVGELLFAGLERDSKAKVQMLRWDEAGKGRFFEASGVGVSRGELAMPVSGSISSRFGMRRHPILGYRRMHSGLDFRARYGSPVYAASDGKVIMAGRNGGYGKFVKISHGGNLASGYAHLSNIAVSNGNHVRRGQVIGYVGSTGLSTGPHLHYELYRGGRAINPLSVKYTERAQLSGRELARFKAELERLKAVTPGAALTGFARTVQAEPEREIDRLAKTISG